MPQRDGYVHGTPGWIDIGSSDLDRTHAFYGSLFGWERQDAGPVEVTGGYGYFLKDGKMVAGYGPAQDPSGGVWWTTYVIVDSAAEVAERITANGGSVIVSPVEVPGAGHFCIAADPGGGAFGLWQMGGHRGAQLVNEAGAMSWNELNTRDLDRSVAFYEAVFGWHEKNGPGSDYREFEVGGEVVAGATVMQSMVPEEVPPYWNAYFGSSDVDRDAGRMPELGGQVLAPPFDIEGVGRIAVLMGPLGETFSLYQF